MTLITSILAGTWGLTAALLVTGLLRLELRIRPAIINAMGLILLFASSIYLLKTGADMISAFKSGERSYFGSLQFFTVFFAWPFAFGILPQLLWLKIFRQQLISLAAIAFVWTMTLFFVPWGMPQLKAMPFSYAGYLEIVGIYTLIFMLVYRFTAKKEILASIQKAKLKKYASSY
jgi:putative effector of murein hydrolase LrgA (UPF0299 family)